MFNLDVILNNVICGDAIKVLKEIPENCINLIITSPPYFGCRFYGNETVGREEDPREYVNKIFEFMVEIKRVLHPQGSLYLNLGDVYFGTKGFSRNDGGFKRKTDHHYTEHKIVPEDGKYLQYKQRLMLPERTAIKMQDDGWILRNNIIWEKLNPIPSFSPDRRLPVYENIFHFVKSKKYFFNYESAKRLDHHRDVIRYNIESFKTHQATFPEKLISPLILTTSKEGDIILDTFMGSGTVGYVSRVLNRNTIGIEINEYFAKSSVKKINESNLHVNNFIRDPIESKLIMFEERKEENVN